MLVVLPAAEARRGSGTVITSELLRLLCRFFFFDIKKRKKRKSSLFPTHRYRYTVTQTHAHKHTHTHTRTYISRCGACVQTRTHSPHSIETNARTHAHTSGHKTSDLCRGLSHISHFSQCRDCELFPSGLTHPENLNKPPISL